MFLLSQHLLGIWRSIDVNLFSFFSLSYGIMFVDLKEFIYYVSRNIKKNACVVMKCDVNVYIKDKDDIWNFLTCFTNYFHMIKIEFEI